MIGRLPSAGIRSPFLTRLPSPFHIAVVTLCASALILSCTSSLRLRASHTTAGAVPTGCTEPAPFTAFGDITYVTDGESYHGRIQTTYIDSATCTVSVYATLGPLLFSLAAGSDSVRVESSGDARTFGIDDPLSSVDFFASYPFTFREAMRTITGTQGTVLSRLGAPDSKSTDARGESTVWHYAGTRVTANARKGGGAIKSIVITPERLASWEITLERFDRCMARSVHCRLGANDYFVIQYGSPRTRSHTETAEVSSARNDTRMYR